MKTKKIYRDARTGRVVSKAYADTHLDTTVYETVPTGKRQKEVASETDATLVEKPESELEKV